jgi:hypothetical protein
MMGWPIAPLAGVAFAALVGCRPPDEAAVQPLQGADVASDATITGEPWRLV